MTTAFLKCITDDPDDVTARLVFADWLREQDDPALAERGEFIHLQHALTVENVPPETRAALVAQQKELLERYRDAWEAAFRGLLKHCDYCLGFAERVTLSVEQLVDGLTELSERTPVVRVVLSGLTQDTVTVLAAESSLSQLRELDLNRQPTSGPGLREFLASPHLGRLRYLNLARTGIGDEGIRALIASNVFPRLRYLNLSHIGMTETGLLSLLSAVLNRGRSLEMLTLRGSPRWPPAAWSLPATLPWRLRQSLQSQLGMKTQEPDLLADLYANRGTLRDDIREWVGWLHARGQFATALKTFPLPVPVREAFTRVCQRRVVWRAEREGVPLPALPIEADGRTNDLPETVRILMRMTDHSREARSLTECLLDLFLRHTRGELSADGRTR